MVRSRKLAANKKRDKTASAASSAVVSPVQPTSTRNDLRAAIKQARRILRKDDGISTDIERLPLLTWLMFLKFLDENETQAEQVAALTGRPYSPLLREVRFHLSGALDWPAHGNLPAATSQVCHFRTTQKCTSQ